jgi:hypothetical protein
MHGEIIFMQNLVGNSLTEGLHWRLRYRLEDFIKVVIHCELN